MQESVSLIPKYATPRVASRLHELDFTVPELEETIADHKSHCDGEPSVYCGTYGKYNDGSLCGLWIDLSSFDDYDEFINFCKAYALIQLHLLEVVTDM